MRVMLQPLRKMVHFVAPLVRENYAEQQFFRPCDLEVAWEELCKLNEKGFYHSLFLCTDNQDTIEVVGYHTFYTMPSLQTCRVVATHDLLFVRKGWRFGRGALLLLQAADALQRKLGVTEVFASHANERQVCSLMERVGYQVVGLQYYKSLLPAKDPRVLAGFLTDQEVKGPGSDSGG